MVEAFSHLLFSFPNIPIQPNPLAVPRLHFRRFDPLSWLGGRGMSDSASGEGGRTRLIVDITHVGHSKPQLASRDPPLASSTDPGIKYS